MTRTSIVTASYLVLLSGSLCVAADFPLAMRPLRPHSGDGKFEDISWRWPWVKVGLPVRGYTIAFPTFTLQNKYEGEFHIRDLPVIGGIPAVVYLCIDDPEHGLSRDAVRKRLSAQICFDVFDENGKSVCHVDAPLAKMHWTDPEGGANCYGLFSLPDSYFAPRKGGQYLLRVRYTPDPQLSSFRGFVHIRCGGSI